MVELLSERPAIFFDRDGVLNESFVFNGKPYAPKKYKDFKVFNGVVDALKVLKKRKYVIIVVTNQPDIGNGLTKLDEVLLMHNELLSTNLIDKIYMCSHKITDNCSCRKPGIKMLTDAKLEFQIDMSSSWLIGDRWSDILAGFNAGVNTILIDYGYPESVGKLKPCVKVKNLKSAVNKILSI
jgi:D-glycero-D-manno-heptose 1,7-bisphosphate phosphatase